MTNILEKVKGILGMANVFEGYLPDKPDTAVAVFEYDANPPEHSFDRTDFLHGIQVRSRAPGASAAHTLAETAALTLNRYNDSEISILQTTTVLDIGRDGANPPRQEYTVNFTLRRK